MDYHNYEIILSPDLAISPADFVTTWNETAESHAIAEAHLSTPKGAQFDPTLLVTIIIGVTTGATANIISDRIIKLLEKHNGQKEHKHTHIEYEEKKDGSKRFIVDTDE
ncbi:MAG TPA: hypothetical protein VNG51_00660 [Ktedonobacteraceae bacterium]|nr:hypothetical protein [Ktedonobacteraceae bacterium]